ncbi:hypothetical protein [Nocardia acidivorans]|nr:hypothetical protein [Nocardia acidivorans]
MRPLSPAREAADPQTAVDEIFRMIEAAWAATSIDHARIRS